jgi:multicomponent Na+:H+ antiporter subunit F
VEQLLWLFALFLLANIAAGLARVVRGPTAEDRMVAVLLFGTTGVALLLVLAEALDSPSIRDVAFVFVVLAATAVVVFGQMAGSPGEESGDERG